MTAGRWPNIQTLPRAVGVVIPTRNRADLLPAMILCARDQTVRPRRIIVVDDGSTDDIAAVVAQYPGVEYVQLEGGDGQPCHPRNLGTNMLGPECAYVCSLDSDDYIPPDYLESLLVTIETDCRAAIAYPRLVQFGDRRGEYHPPYDPLELGRANLAASTSLVRLDSLRQVGGWLSPPNKYGHEDWATWRALRGLGWTLLPSPAVYYWRRHEDSRTALIRREYECDWLKTIDDRDLLTIAVPFCGRRELLAPLLKVIAEQSWSSPHTKFIALDNSGDPRFGRELRDAVNALPFGDVRYMRDDVRGHAGITNQEVAGSPREQLGIEIGHRVAGVWNRIGQAISTDLVWCLEDDNLPQRDTLAKLLASMRADVDAVFAPYIARTGDWCCWEYASLDPPRVAMIKNRGVGVEKIGGCGFGCTLVRRDVFAQGPFRSLGSPPHGHNWFDANVWADVARRGRAVLCDWEAVVDHVMPENKVTALVHCERRKASKEKVGRRGK